MPKFKTHSGTKDRVRITKNGKVRRGHISGNHHLEKKSASRKRRISGLETMTGKFTKTIKNQLGV
jgi:large subunit ribosomal protein L35